MIEVAISSLKASLPDIYPATVSKEACESESDCDENVGGDAKENGENNENGAGA